MAITVRRIPEVFRGRQYLGEEWGKGFARSMRGHGHPAVAVTRWIGQAASHSVAVDDA